MPRDAWDLLRISSMKTFRALQTLAKLVTQLASDISKHRCAVQTIPAYFIQALIKLWVVNILVDLLHV